MRKIISLFLILAVTEPLVIKGQETSGVVAVHAVTSEVASFRGFGDRADLVDRLDVIVRNAVAREPLAGVSVAVLREHDMLLRRGYGYADLGLKAPATEETTFRLMGPAIAAAIMQQVEQGRLRLDDETSRLLPEFPWQGRRVSVRQLLDATSGLQDFHYLGDPQRSQRSVPKAHDEVTALFAGRPFTHEPGSSYQWTISGIHLAGLLLERVSGQPYPEYLREHIFARAGLTRSFYCDDRSVTPGLSRSYDVVRGRFLNFPLETATMYPFIATVCTSAADAVSLMRALRDGRLLRPETYRLLTTAEGPARNYSMQASRGISLRLSQEEGRRWVGEFGSLMGFSSAVMDFPDDSLTIAVLSNTERSGAAAYIARSLARAVLGIPPLPQRQIPQEEPLPTKAAAVTAAKGMPFVGVYRTKWAEPAGPFKHWQRTYRVFLESGRLMIQALGETPEPLLHRGDNNFTIASWAVSIIFTLDQGRPVTMTLREPGGGLLTGPRVEDRWPITAASTR